MVNPIYRVMSTSFFLVNTESKEQALTKVRVNAYIDSTYNELFSDDNEPRGKAGKKTARLESEFPLIVAYECMWTVQCETPDEAVTFVEDNIVSGSMSDDLILQKEIINFVGNSKYKYFVN